MKLESDGQRAVLDPESSQIQSAVSSLSHPNRTFLILSRSQTSFIQVAITAPDRFLLEYQEGGVQEHFQSTRTDFSGDEVIRALEAYRRGDESWRHEIEWRRLAWG